MRRWIYTLGDWLLDRAFNPSGRYRDGRRLETWAELRATPRGSKAGGCRGSQ